MTLRFINYKTRVSSVAMGLALAVTGGGLFSGAAQAQSSDDVVASDDVVITDDDAARRFDPITVTAR
ncbi:MAG: hypothetical protein L3J02_03825 [Henriciella sp.]|nr:hypothetical protein [Henriciella sp.]